MSHLSVKTALEQYLKTNWTATSIKWDNVPFDPSEVDEFISPTLLPVVSARELIGSASPYLDSYILHINIFVRVGRGGGRALELADILDALLKERTIGNVDIGVPTVNVIGIYSEFYQVAIKFPCRQWR